MSVTPRDEMPAHESDPFPTPAATLDADGLTCGSLEPLIAQHLRPLAPGDVLEVHSDRAEAADGIRAWVSLTGHTLVKIQTASSRRTTYFIRKKTPKMPA
jgi:TusA-related sulfurtransferase